MPHIWVEKLLTFSYYKKRNSFHIFMGSRILCGLWSAVLMAGCWSNSQKLSMASDERTVSEWLTKQPTATIAVLKKKVNWRSGPGSDHDALWCYESPGWPVQIVKKYDNWYLVRDVVGTQGWVKGSMLSFKQGGVVIQQTSVRSSPGGAEKAILAKGVLVSYKKLSDPWIYVQVSSSGSLSGWIAKSAVWPHPHKI